jgi:hypothetical protein
VGPPSQNSDKLHEHLNLFHIRETDLRRNYFKIRLYSSCWRWPKPFELKGAGSVAENYIVRKLHVLAIFRKRPRRHPLFCRMRTDVRAMWLVFSVEGGRTSPPQNSRGGIVIVRVLGPIVLCSGVL